MLLSFEQKLFGTKLEDGWRRSRFARARPNFDKDLREILEDPNVPRYPEEPEAYLGRTIYSHLQRYMESFELPTEYLLWCSTGGTMADIFHETDGFVFVWIKKPILITLDAFNLSIDTFEYLKDYWIDICRGFSYTWTNLQNDLFRFKRIFSEKRRNLKDHQDFSDQEALREIYWWIRSPGFQETWESGYVAEVPKHFIERPVNRPCNQFIITPSMVEGRRGNRRAFAKRIAQYILGKAGESAPPA